MKPIIVIIGPTGVGKTKLSIELAKKLDAEIINGDSVSIYKHLDIGSAKPSVEEREGIVHHLIDIREVVDEYSVYDYQQDARKVIDDITSRGKRVIIVGGTGLYIKAALYNYVFTKGTIHNSYDHLSGEELLKKIKEYDKDIDIHPNNRKRLVRVLNKLENQEVITNEKNVCLYPIQVIGLTAEREVVYERINQRVDVMIENGLLDEVSSLKQYYSKSRVLNSAIGYKEFYNYFFGDWSLDDVIDKIKLNSRHYAKRQYTFFNHQFPTQWYDVCFEHFDRTIEEIYTDIYM
ncbi:MAG TPA: tRNA (adenosine(37)-N6)-dimethylallyltransferase MiaA [Candidatus Faecimonas gallistercoris]|nr:tRNA (adenosine(37)-N6)-dimethylallyltransferase MiaA [Candidatus Faecimonas gallistercoris]